MMNILTYEVSTVRGQGHVITGTGSPCIGPYVPDGHDIVHVTLTDAAKSTQIQNVESPYSFHFTVRPGTYRLSEPGANPVIVHVDAGQTVRAHLLAECL